MQTTTDSTATPLPRMTGVLIIEVNESNPNGDPDRESDPRTLPNKHGVISAVSFKRKLRDLVLEKDGAVWKEVSKNLKLSSERFGILEMRGRDRDDIKKLLTANDELRGFHDAYWDARVFGNTYLESGKDEGKKEKKKKDGDGDGESEGTSATIRNGVVQFVNAHSVCPVEIKRDTNTNKSGVQEGKDRGMAPLGDRRVLHGVYVMPFFVNPALAHKTYCSMEDVSLALALLRCAYPATASRARPFVDVKHAFVMDHKSVLGSCSDFEIVKRFTPWRLDGKTEEASTSWEQYGLNQDLGPLEGRVINFRDLCKD